MLLKTASGDFNYEDIFYGEKLSVLIKIVHKELSRQLHWKSNPLKPCSFGYDSFACSIGFLLMNFPANIEEGSKQVHNAWVRNYLFWTIIKPHELLPECYLHPSKPLIDKRRKILSITPYENLPENEKETNRIIVKTLFDYLKISYPKESLNDDTFLD
jgi:hypothetical protein